MIFDFFFGRNKLKAENEMLKARIEFLEERNAEYAISWVDQEKELDRLREDIKFLDPGCRERGCVAVDRFDVINHVVNEG